MCGLAGTQTGRIRQMLQQLEHRGPDGWCINEEGGWTLGHRLLAIRDSDAQQPFRRSGMTWVVNGEIYNWRALRAELEDSGWDFYTQSDSEIVGPLWKEYGPAAFRLLRGEFAIAIIDDGKRILARDPFGIKPLYVDTHGSFASEIRPLDHGGIGRDGAARCLSNLHPPGTTPYRQVRSVLPGHYEVDNQIRPYWTPSFSEGHQSLAILERLVSDACEIRAHYADTVLYRSAGVDSEVVARYACPTHQLFFDTGTEEKPGEATVLYDYAPFEEAVIANEKPFYDELVCAKLALARVAKDLGARVSLSGQGADELFAGYPFFWGRGGDARLCHGGVREYLGPHWSQSWQRMGDIAYQFLHRKYDWNDWLYRVPETIHGEMASFLTMLEQQLLWTSDRMDMSASVEGRVPLLDIRLADYAFSIKKEPDKKFFRMLAGSTPKRPFMSGRTHAREATPPSYFLDGAFEQWRESADPSDPSTIAICNVVEGLNILENS